MKNEKTYILYLGGIFSEEIMLTNPAVSPAANRWQKGLVSSIMNAGESVVVLGHQPERLWPKGALRIGDLSSLPANMTGISVPYYNVPLLRKCSLKHSYLNGFDALCQKYGLPKCIVSYNLYFHNIATGLYAQRNFNIPWIPIVADIPENQSELTKHDQALHEAEGRIFLSWGVCESCADVPKLHLDGGVEKILKLPIVAEGSPFIIFFSGAMNKWAGVELLIQAFARIFRKDVKLWLCGKAIDEDTITNAICADKRITYFGCVSDKRLEELAGQSTIMVNPRDSSLLGNKMNFPSKVLEYLTYCKPVISTWTDGLSPEYSDVLLIAEKATPDGIAVKIEEILEWDQNKLAEYGQKAATFLSSKKTWDIQAQRFVKFINKISNTSRN
ncbi:MAG: glycosyltransferase [Lentisphaerota bacterium]